MVAILNECSDHKEIYGVLYVDNISYKEVQEMIYDIKNKFIEEGFEDWTLKDVFEEFPEEWGWWFEKDVDRIEI